MATIFFTAIPTYGILPFTMIVYYVCAVCYMCVSVVTPMKLCTIPFCGECCVLSLCSYSSGGEDGYVRVHTFDPSYFEFKFE